MSFETTRAAITDRFKTAWNNATLPVVYENQPQPSQAAAWGRFSVMQGGSDPVAIGAPASKRVTGAVFLQIFLPLNSGTKKAHDCADAFVAIFDQARFRSGSHYFVFDNAGMVDAGERGGWLQKNVRVQFRRDTLL